MIKQRAHAMKPFCSEELLIIHSAVRLFVNDVSFVWNVSELMVKRHLDRVVRANVIGCFLGKTKIYQLPFYRLGLDAPFDFCGSITSITANAFG